MPQTLQSKQTRQCLMQDNQNNNTISHPETSGFSGNQKQAILHFHHHFSDKTNMVSGRSTKGVCLMALTFLVCMTGIVLINSYSKFPVICPIVTIILLLVIFIQALVLYVKFLPRDLKQIYQKYEKTYQDMLLAHEIVIQARFWEQKQIKRYYDADKNEFKKKEVETGKLHIEITLTLIEQTSEMIQFEEIDIQDIEVSGQLAFPKSKEDQN